MRMFVAFLLAPLGTIPAIFCCMLVGWLSGIGEMTTASFVEMIAGALFFSVYAVVVAYVVMATLGWIAVWLSRVYDWLGATHYALLGIIVGILPFLTYFSYALIADGFGVSGFDWNKALETSIDAFPVGAAYTVFGGISGMFCALLFWWLALRNRLDAQVS